MTISFPRTNPVLLTPPRRRINCIACDSWFYVEYNSDGRPMHDCPKLGGLSLPLASFPELNQPLES